MEILNELWVEKFRPKNLDDLVLPKENKSEFVKFIENQSIPNLLLYGPPGGGKTTIAKIIASKYGVIANPKDNLLIVNGSAKETRSIAYVNNVIEPFLKVPPAGNDKFKIVFVDEGDYLTDEAIHSLRGIIEKYQVKYGRFILTCNYVNNLPDAFQSRFTGYHFKQLPVEFITKYCDSILDKEDIKYDEKDLDFVITSLYPDVRKIVNKLQRFSATGKLVVDRTSVETTEKAIIASVSEAVDYIKNGQKQKIGKTISNIINLLDKNDFDFRNVYSNLFYSKHIPVPAKIILNKYSNAHQEALVSSMHFMSCVFDIIQTLGSYYDSIKKG